MNIVATDVCDFLDHISASDFRATCSAFSSELYVPLIKCLARRLVPGTVFGAAFALCGIAKRGHVRAIAVVSASLDDESPEVRKAALETLEWFCERGDAATIAKVFARLNDEDGHVRAAAVGLLAQIAGKGHSVVIAALEEQIVDEEDEVRERAVLSC